MDLRKFGSSLFQRVGDFLTFTKVDPHVKKDLEKVLGYNVPGDTGGTDFIPIEIWEILKAEEKQIYGNIQPVYEKDTVNN